MSDALDTLMRSARWRSTLVASMRAAGRGLAFGAAALLAVALWHRFVAPAPELLAALVLVLPVALALAATWRSLPAPLTLAGTIDQRFGTCSLMASAWATRADAPTPATRIVLADARTRAAELRAELPSVWPIRLPASLALSVAGVLAATFLLVRPGSPARLFHTPTTAMPAAGNATTSAAPLARNAQARDAARSPAGRGPAAARSAAQVEAEPRPAVAASETAAATTTDTGNAPGRTAGTPATTEADTAMLSTHWRERARLPGIGAAADTGDTGTERAVSGSMQDEAAQTIAAAYSQAPSYEPALDPALAAYVRAVARESKR